MVSGMDRDSFVTALTQGTQTKIDKANQSITSLEWKQEAYQGLTDQVLSLEDDFLSYTSSKSVVDASLYEKNVITTQGNADSAKFVTASGASAMTSYVAIQGVTQLATSATTVSNAKTTGTGINTSLDFTKTSPVSNLSGKALQFGVYNSKEDRFDGIGTFEFGESYTGENGKSVTIDYTADAETLASQLNEYAKQNFNSDDISISFKVDNGRLSFDLSGKNVTNETQINNKGTLGDKAGGYKTNALSVLGGDTSAALPVKTFSENAGTYTQSLNSEKSAVQLLKDNKLTIAYGSNEAKQINLLTQEDGITESSSMEEIQAAIQKNLNQVFGSTAPVKAEIVDNKLTLKVADDDNSSLTISSDNKAFLKNLGIEPNTSNKVSRESSIFTNMDKLGITLDGSYATDDEKKAALSEKLSNLTINGVKIDGITADTTVDAMLDKINASKAGVKATYLASSGKFALIATETGEGRTIDLGAADGAASQIFAGESKDGQNAKMTISYGGSVSEELSSSSNNFNIDGLKVSVTGTFGYDQASGEFDSSKQVTFSAASNVDKAKDRVKEFIEAYNKIVEETNTHVTKRPDSGYPPLTEAQEDEMTESEIEKWNKKAKEGILYNESTMRDFSSALHGMMAKVLRDGVSYQDMEDIGITMSDDYFDGGKLVFDEEKFKKAMEAEPEKVSRVMTGSGSSSSGLASVINKEFTVYATRYATRNGGSYGRLAEEAGSAKLPLTAVKNNIYNQIKEKNSLLDTLKDRLKQQQERVIDQFTRMESLINNYNTQSGYLSSLMG